MSAINLCERCDAFMLGKAVAVIRLDKTPSSYTETLEICPACVTDFMDFMHSAPTRDKNVFREPYKEPEPPADAPALTTGG